VTDTLAGLKQKQNGARDLQSVVRAMKAPGGRQYRPV